MEALKNILHELRNDQRKAGDVSMLKDGVAPQPHSRRNRDEERPSARGHIFYKRSSSAGNQSLGEHKYETSGRLHSRRNSSNDNKWENAKESELRQHLHDIEQERD